MRVVPARIGRGLLSHGDCDVRGHHDAALARHARPAAGGDGPLPRASRRPSPATAAPGATARSARRPSSRCTCSPPPARSRRRCSDRVYSFLDWDGWSGERVVLRPDSTIPTARLYVESLDGGRVAKLFYTPERLSLHRRRLVARGVAVRRRADRRHGRGRRRRAGRCWRSRRCEPLGSRDIDGRLSHAGLVRAVLAAAGPRRRGAVGARTTACSTAT